MSGSPETPTSPDTPPEGSDQVWGMISSLVAGPVAWGGIGYGVDVLAGSGVFLPAGAVFGFVSSLTWVLYRFSHPVQTSPRTTSPIDRSTKSRRGERR
jgi:hypothetical protein